MNRYSIMTVRLMIGRSDRSLSIIMQKKRAGDTAEIAR